MFGSQKENYAEIKIKAIYLTNNIVLIMEASITATASHLQDFRLLPHCT
jgi:hypothetical protein